MMNYKFFLGMVCNGKCNWKLTATQLPSVKKTKLTFQ